MAGTYTTQQVEAMMEKLAEPFDPSLLYYKPQAVTKDKKRCMVAVYADPRAYFDRLNEVCPGQWSESYQLQVVPYRGREKQGTEWVTVEGTKLVIIAQVTINGLGTHESIGESSTDDENVATAAEAQAFKRACAKFGLGRYLYDFPKGQWVDYDEQARKVKNPPPLPEFAMPKIICEGCNNLVTPTEYAGRTIEVSAIVSQGQKKYGMKLCALCQRKKREEAGSAADARLRNERTV